MAKVEKSNRFIGVEAENKKCVIATGKANQNSLKNVIFINTEGLRFLKRFVRTASVGVLHIYFPTPYHFGSESFHTLASFDFAKEAFRVLENGGVMRLLTGAVVLRRR